MIRKGQQAADLPLNARVAESVVDDPLEQGAKLTVVRTLRDDPLARMRDKGHIDEAKYIAGRHWQKDYEAAEIGGIAAVDTTKEPVDGRTFPEFLTDRKIAAIKAISNADAVLGVEGASLIRDFLGRRMWSVEIAAARGISDQRTIDFIARRCRECLETLAYYYGYAHKSGRGKAGNIRAWRGS